jgi:hypothetical protein
VIILNSKELPVELNEQVFSYFSKKESGKLMCVCKAWQNAIQNDLTTPVPPGRYHFYSNKVMEEVYTRKFPKYIIEILHDSGVFLVNFVKKEGMEGPIHRVEGSAPVCIHTDISYDKRPSKMITFRFMAKGPLQYYASFLGKRIPFNKIIGTCSISDKGVAYGNIEDNTEGATGNTFWDLYSVFPDGFMRLFNNPISLVWLYCGGGTPYTDLRPYLPIKDEMHLF